MVRWIVVLVVMAVLVSGCSRGEDYEYLFSELRVVEESYTDSNPALFSADPLSYGMVLSGKEYCFFMELFHELRIDGVVVSEECPGVLVGRSRLSSLDGSARVSLFGPNASMVFDADNYSRIDSYSLLLTYALDDADAARRFASEVYDLVLETYDSQYIPVGPLDMPRYVAAPASMEFVGYARAIAPFIEYEDEIGVFHVVVFQRDEFVLVHKVYSDEQRIRVNY